MLNFSLCIFAILTWGQNKIEIEKQSTFFEHISFDIIAISIFVIYYFKPFLG